MQIQKDYVQLAIIESARKEFLEKGFRNTSLRSIAKNANVSLSNIYNYFSDKDAIFLFIFKDILDNIDEWKKSVESLDCQHDQHDEQDHIKMLKEPMMYVDQNKEMFKLLFFNAEGSSLFGIQDRLIQWFAMLMEKECADLCIKHNVSLVKPSEFFLHLLGSMWIHLIEDSLLKDLSPDHIKLHSEELMRFLYHGYLGYLGISHH